MEIEGLRIHGKEGRWQCEEYQPRTRRYKSIDCPDDLPEIMDYDYELQTSRSSLYRCGLDGECHRDLEGEPLDSCQRKCQAAEIRDLTALTLGYIPEAALDLPLTDQIRAVREITGVTLPARRARLVLTYLVNGDLWELSHVEGLEDYLATQPEVPLIRFVHDLVKRIPDLNYNLPLDYPALTEQVRSVFRRYGGDLVHETDSDRERESFEHLTADLISLFLWDVEEDVIQATGEKILERLTPIEPVLRSVFGEEEYEGLLQAAEEGPKQEYVNSDSEPE